MQVTASIIQLQFAELPTVVQLEYKLHEDGSTTMKALA